MVILEIAVTVYSQGDITHSRNPRKGVLLGEGPIRFNEIKRTIGGISQRMLTSTLRGLERDGLVKRTVRPTNPPQVQYALTKLGRTLLDPVRVLAVWAQGHRGEVVKARAAFDHAAGRQHFST